MRTFDRWTSLLWLNTPQTLRRPYTQARPCNLSVIIVSVSANNSSDSAVYTAVRHFDAAGRRYRFRTVLTIFSPDKHLQGPRERWRRATAELVVFIVTTLSNFPTKPDAKNHEFSSLLFFSHLLYFLFSIVRLNKKPFED